MVRVSAEYGLNRAQRISRAYQSTGIHLAGGFLIESSFAIY